MNLRHVSLRIFYSKYIMLIINFFFIYFLDIVIFDKLLFVAWLDQLVLLLRLSSWLGLVWAPKKSIYVMLS